MIFDKLLERRSHPENPKYGILEALAGSGINTYTGKTVNENTAITLSVVYACIRVLAETVASLPLHLYKRRPDGKGKDRGMGHPLYDVLHNRPNPEMTSMIFREVLTSHVAGWGNAYAEIVTNRNNIVSELWPLRPDKMKVSRQAGKLVYNYSTSKRTVTLPQERVLHIPGLGYDGIVGYSPIAKAREAIGLGLATEEFGARWFGNGARPSGVLTHPEQLSPEAKQNVRKSWNETFQGTEKSNRVAVLEEGIKYQPISISPEDSQFLETRKFQVEEICRIFRVPLHLVQNLDRATFSNIEFQSIDFVTHTIRPWLVRLEQAFSQQLLSESDRKIYFFEHLVDGLLRGDIKSRYEAYASGRSNGWLSANDIREKENLNPIENGGDVYLVPLNMVPADQVGQMMDKPQRDNRSLEISENREKANIESIQRLKRSYRNLFQDAAQRIVNKEASAITRMAKNQLRDKITFIQKVEEFYKTMPEYIRTNLLPAKRAFAEQVYNEALSQIGMDPSRVIANVDQWIQEYIDTYAQRHVGSSLGQIRSLAGKPQAEDLVVERMNDWKLKRSGKIAFNEVTRMTGFISLKTWQNVGVKYKRWVAVGESCPYCEKLASGDGAIVEIEKNFLEQGDVIHAQYDAKTKDGKTEKKWGTMSIPTALGHPPAHQGCNCLVAWER